MTSIISTLAPRSLSRFVALLVLGAMVLGTSAADAALTTGKCLAQKSKAWGNLRKCQATARAKILEGKVGDLTKCQTTFQSALTKITANATKALIPCRYGANGDFGAVTDYDTGLQWEQKEGEVGGFCLLLVDRVNHCVNATYTWADAQSFVSGVSSDGTTVSSFFPGAADDWRLPTIAELRTILNTTVPGCQSGSSPCIDPIFGPTVAYGYWSATTFAANPAYAWPVYFGSGGYVPLDSKGGNLYVRAVRAGL